MKSILSLSVVFVFSAVGGVAGWERTELLGDFHAEGAGVGDIDGDGKVDIAYGPFWFSGPDFGTKTRFADGEKFDGTKGYSDNFLSFVHDFNGDDLGDVLVLGFPGKEARLYLNPGKGAEGNWPMHLVASEVANESPHLDDLIRGGQPEIVCARDGTYGYYQAGEEVSAPWTWHAVSAKGDAITPYGHGLGVGDINGDGRADVIEKMYWYEQPEEGSDWKRHNWALLPYGKGGAQILVDDFDGDGDNDIATSLHAHAWGLAWFEQRAPGKFSRHTIMGERAEDSPHGIVFSQLHALALVDMDGDGRNDFVTGKRYFAHQGKDPGGHQEAVLYWFRNVKGGEGEAPVMWEPHLIDRDSGVGTQVNAVDFNGDGRPDVLTSSKKGLIVHRQKEEAASGKTGVTEL